jgi:hypothetical protein
MRHISDRVRLYKLLRRVSAFLLGRIAAEMSGGIEQGKRKKDCTRMQSKRRL